MDYNVHSGFVRLDVEELMKARCEVKWVGPHGFAMVCCGLICLLKVSVEALHVVGDIWVVDPVAVDVGDTDDFCELGCDLSSFSYFLHMRECWWVVPPCFKGLNSSWVVMVIAWHEAFSSLFIFHMVPEGVSKHRWWWCRCCGVGGSTSYDYEF